MLRVGQAVLEPPRIPALTKEDDVSGFWVKDASDTREVSLGVIQGSRLTINYEDPVNIISPKHIKLRELNSDWKQRYFQQDWPFFTFVGST